jgi:hypothetical protein
MKAKSSDSAGLLLYTIVTLAVLTGILHLALVPSALGIGGVPGATIFALMAVGYFAGAVLIAANSRPRLWMKVGVVYTQLLIVLWAVGAALDFPGTRAPLAYADKAVEALLVWALLVALLRNGAVAAGPEPQAVPVGRP